MKTKFLFLLAALTLSFSVMALAQKKNDPARSPQQQNPPVMQQLGKVTLTCSPGQGKDVSTPLKVKNPTGQDVPSGTVISWSAKSGGTATGKETTTQVLKKNNGNEISLLGPPGNLASCQAWYFKK